MKTNNTADFSVIMDVIILWSNIVLGVFMGLAVIFAIWKSILILISIIRNADNPEARGNDLSALKFPIIMIISILIFIAVMNVILQAVKTYNPSIGT